MEVFERTVETAFTKMLQTLYQGYYLSARGTPVDTENQQKKSSGDTSKIW